jgi:hypothetical protein
MRQLSMASAAVVMTPTGGSKAAHADSSQRDSFSAAQASNASDAMLAIAIVVAAWAVALWGVGYLSHLAS